jgi:hypothetical protein
MRNGIALRATMTKNDWNKNNIRYGIHDWWWFHTRQVWTFAQQSAFAIFLQSETFTAPEFFLNTSSSNNKNNKTLWLNTKW